MTHRRVSVLGVLVSLVFAALLLTGCGSGSGSGGGGGGGGSATSTTTTTAPDTIVIKNFAFHPATLTVSPGAKVTVKNEDSATHTVTATGSKQFDTGDVAPGTTKTFSAPTKAGSYPYICSIHNYMQGTLVVK